MIITLMFCVDVKWPISRNVLYFPNLSSVIDRQHLCHFESTLLWWLRHSRSMSILQLQGIFQHNPFTWSWCSHLLGNFLVACICAWRHILGVWLYSNFEDRLILLSCLVESVSSAILHCQSYLRECVSRKGLLHFSGIGICPEVVLRHWIVSWHKRMFPEWQEVEVERSIEFQGRVLLKMIIPNQDKMERLLLLQLNAQVPEEEQIWIQVTISKQKNQELGIILIMQPLQSVQMPIMKNKEFLCSMLTALLNQYLMLHRDWRIKNLKIQINKSYYFNILHLFGTETYVFLLCKRKSMVIKPIFPLFLQQFDYLRLLFKIKLFFPWLWSLRWGWWIFASSESYNDPHHLKRFS